MWVKFIILLVGLPTIYGQNPCDTGNGGCSHNCIFLGPNENRCGCPCDFVLGPDNLTCVPDVTCDLDILFVIDDSNVFDFQDCSFVQFGLAPPTNFTNFKIFRDQVISVLRGFENYDANIGVQFYDDAVTNVLDYADNDLAAVLDQYQARNMPLTCTSKKSYGSHLTFDIEEDPLNRLNFQYLGPGPRGDPSTTTRIAIVFVYQVTDSLQDMMTNINAARQGLDAIIVIAGGDSSVFTPGEPINRFAACGDENAVVCPALFYLQRDNDMNLPANLAFLELNFNRDSCLSRRIPPTVEVLCDPQFQVVVPICLLEGLTPADLILSDEQCTIEFTEVNRNYEIEIPSLICGLNTTATPNGFQSSQRITLASPANSNVMFDETAVCMYNSTPIVPPALPTFVEQEFCFEHDPTFIVDFQYTRDSEFIEFHPDNSQIDVGCALFFEATSNLPSALTLKAKDCKATNSTPSDTATKVWPLITDGCPVDPTVKIIAPQADEYRFYLTMFEFVSTLNQPNEDKIPVYFTCSFVACPMDSTAPECNPACGARKKRSTENIQTISRTVGLFIG